MEQKGHQLEEAYFPQNGSVLYFQPDYLATQQYSRLKVIKNQHFFSCFSMEGDTAKSLPKSPFGGIYMAGPERAFGDFHLQLETELSREGIKQIYINQPPEYYQNFVPTAWLLNTGYRLEISETNQYLSLSGPLTDRLHTMEKRKLQKVSQLDIGKTNAVREVHDFISKCRQQVGLEINISEERLMKLIELLPERYEIFEARKNGKRIAAVVMNRPADRIAYYYLPATDPDFKNLSPMVSLLQYIYVFYQAKDFRYIDLGISSVHGKLQQSLYTFKERMGAVSTQKQLLLKNL